MTIFGIHSLMVGPQRSDWGATSALGYTVDAGEPGGRAGSMGLGAMAPGGSAQIAAWFGTPRE
jgi:hypothetical protein